MNATLAFEPARSAFDSAAIHKTSLATRSSPRAAATTTATVDSASPIQSTWLNRPRRVLFALAAVWTLNIFDLGFTLIESAWNPFVELNPLAARLLAEPIWVVAYKAGLIVLGSTILLFYRTHHAAELASWFILATYAAVLCKWALYYSHLLAALNDPAVNVAPVFVWFLH